MQNEPENPFGSDDDLINDLLAEKNRSCRPANEDVVIASNPSDKPANEDVIASTPNDKPEANEDVVLASSSNRRHRTRYDLSVDVVCFPMLDSMEVDFKRRIDGIIVDISESGVGLNLATQFVDDHSFWVLGVEVSNNLWKFLDFQVRKSEPVGQTSTHVNAEFASPIHRVFAEELLLPAFDTQHFQYRFPVSNSVLTSLCSIGALERTVMDHVLVCPDCSSVPTVRKGCCVCLSNETGKTKMIHHFACAHVDFVERFDQGNEIVCPKCLGRRMIVGADYEYLDGPTQCFECGHNDLEEILIGHCMKCSNRFPFDQAKSIEVLGYRVNQLDPLALLNRN